MELVFNYFDFSCGKQYTNKSLPFHLQWCLIKQQAKTALVSKSFRCKVAVPPKLSLPHDESSYAEYQR